MGSSTLGLLAQLLLLVALALVFSAKPNGYAVREFGLLLAVDRGLRLSFPEAAVVGGSTIVACG